MSLTAYRITTTSGYTWVTSMAKGVTLEHAKRYFLGQFFNVASFPKERMEQAIKVEKIR